MHFSVSTETTGSEEKEIDARVGTYEKRAQCEYYNLTIKEKYLSHSINAEEIRKTLYRFVFILVRNHQQCISKMPELEEMTRSWSP